jgi:hypothetical protein
MHCSMALLRSGRQWQFYERSAVWGPTWRRTEYFGRNTAKIRNFGAAKSHVPKLPFKLVKCRSILTRRGLDVPASKAGGTKFHPPSPRPDQSGPGVYPDFCTRGTGALSWEQAVKPWHWPPTPHGTAVKNEWSCMSAPLFCFVWHLSFRIWKWSWKHYSFFSVFQWFLNVTFPDL